MALLTTQTASTTGAQPTFTAAAAGGDTVSPSADTFLWVKNGSGASITVTLTAETQCSHGFLHDGGGAVPAGEDRIFGPITPQRFQRSSDSLAAVTYTDVTTVTVAAFR